MKVAAFTPQDAATISQDVIGRCEKLVNEITMRSRRDKLDRLDREVAAAADALAKARLCAEVVWRRLAYDGFEYGPDERLEEYVGANVCHRGIPVEGADAPSEVVLRLGVKGPDYAKVERFGTELVPLVTSGPPGVTGFAGGRPKATEIIGYWPALIAKDKIHTRVTTFEA